jgi:hypothetical protein
MTTGSAHKIDLRNSYINLNLVHRVLAGSYRNTGMESLLLVSTRSANGFAIADER